MAGWWLLIGWLMAGWVAAWWPVEGWLSTGVGQLMVDNLLSSGSRLIHGWLEAGCRSLIGWLILEVLVIVSLVAASTKTLVKMEGFFKGIFLDGFLHHFPGLEAIRWSFTYLRKAPRL
jgi:hypothetical protein